MAEYTYIVVDTVTGDALEEIPLSGVTYNNGLNGAGAFTGSISTAHPKCNKSLLKTLAREMLVMREGVPVFLGPILGLTGNASTRTLTIAAAPVWWYMTRRTLELGRHYVDQDLSAIVADILDSVNGKFLGDIRLGRETPYTSTGQLHTISYDAITRKLAADAINELCQIYPGFDYSVNLRVDPANGKVLREFQVYPGFKGVLRDQALTVANTIDFTDTNDGSRVYNRVHELGAGSGNTQLIVSRSAYEPDAYYDYGQYTTGWTVSGSAGISQTQGRPIPSFSAHSNGSMRRSYTHGVGSVIEFDYFHDGGGTDSTSNTDTGAVNQSALFHFGADSAGVGMAWSPFISSGGVSGCGLTIASAWGASASTANNRVSNKRLQFGQWYRVMVKIESSSVARVYVDGQEIQYYNGSTYAYGFPIALSGNFFGLTGLGAQAAYGTHYFDNITVPQPVSTYTNPGIPYIELVQSRTDVTDLKTLQFYAQADLFLGQWPAQVYSVKYRPSASLPYGFCEPGDTVPIDIKDGYFDTVGTKRVVSIPVTVEVGGGEVVELVFNDVHA